MSFATYVARVFGKRPVWLYRITIGATEYHFTSRGAGYTTPADRPNVEFPSGQVWTATSIIRGEIFQTAKANRNDTWIRLPTSNAVSAALIAGRNHDATKVDIWKGYVGDPDDEFVLQFTGRIVEIEPAMLLTTIICETSISATRRSSMAEVVQRSCRHAHYFTHADGGGCRLNLPDFQVSAEATAAAGRTIIIPDASGVADGLYMAGILEYDGEVYMIESHVGSTIIVEKPVEGLADAIAGGTTNVLIAEGCDLTATRCNAFGNILNFGGFNDMNQAPFDGRSIA